MNTAKRGVAILTLITMLVPPVPIPVTVREPIYALPSFGQTAPASAVSANAVAAEGATKVGALGDTSTAPTAPASAVSASAVSASAVSASAVQTTARAEVLIEPESGGAVELEGVRVELPPGALTEPTRISISSLATVEDTGEEIANVTSGARGYRFEPHGTVFAKPVTISMPFDPALCESEVGLSNLYTYFYDDKSFRWERLSRIDIDREKALIRSSTTHFTDMINGTLKLPEGPKSVQFDVNSIKNLEAANPGSGVPTIEGPSPSSFGSNSFSIPLRLPAGRGGAAPQLSLRYSSDSSNSWLGRGFDIDVPAVTIDTRFGLPRYDGKDLYSLGGDELVPVADGRPGALRFRPRVERSFQQIYWVRSGAEDYWEVTDKDGTVREYGRGEAWIGPDRNDRSRTFIWYLSKVRDRFGNTIDYSYTYDAENRCTYLSEIRYSGYEKNGRVERGMYALHFVLDDREDRRIDARGHFA